MLVKPQFPVVNVSHPLARSLKFAFCAQPGILSDLAPDYRLVPTAASTVATWPDGYSVKMTAAYTNTTAQFNAAATPHLNISDKLTVWAMFYTNAVANAYCNILTRFRYSSISNNAGYMLRTENNKRVSLTVFNNSTGSAGDSTDLVAGRIYNVAGSFDGSVTPKMRFYRDGRFINSGNPAFTTIGSNTTVGLGLGELVGSADYRCLAAGIWNRVLSAAEVLLLNTDPFALFRPPDRNIVLRSLAAPDQYLTGNAGIASALVLGAGGAVVAYSYLTGDAGIPAASALGADGTVTGWAYLVGNAGIPSSAVPGTDGVLISTAYLVGVSIPAGSVVGENGVLLSWGDLRNVDLELVRLNIWKAALRPNMPAAILLAKHNFGSKIVPDSRVSPAAMPPAGI